MYSQLDGANLLAPLINPGSDEILHDFHDGPLGGNIGAEKTLAHLKERYYWPGHHTDVTDWCRNCPIICSTAAEEPRSSISECPREDLSNPNQPVFASLSCDKA